MGAFGKQSDGETFSGSTLNQFLEDWNVPYQSLQVLREMQQKAFRHPWWWDLSSKDVLNEAFREKGYVMLRMSLQLQAVASKEMHWVCLWYPNSKMAIVK